MQSEKWIYHIRELVTIIILLFSLLCFPAMGLAGIGILNDYNPWDVPILDNGGAFNSDLSLSEAPADAKITKVEIYYEIKHQRPSDLDVWLTCYDGGWQGDYFLHTQGSSASVDRINVGNIHTWDGKSPNVTWYLVARDNVTGMTGYIDFFELWITYETNDAPSTPSNPNPTNGATNVSRTTNLSWSCSDPNGDTIYYTVYFEKNNSSPDNIVKNDSTGTNADPGRLDYDADYYWRVKADDHKGGVTWGPSSGSYHFHTEPVPVIDALITVNAISSLQAGSIVIIPYTVTNNGNVSHAFGVGAEIWKDGVKQDDVDTHTTPSVSPGSTTSASFTYDIPQEWNGTYVARCAVWSGTPGGSGSTWLDSSDRNFTVEITTLPPLSGRIAFHRDSDNKHSPHEPINTDDGDGNIFIYDLKGGESPKNVTANFDIGQAMNPHFSPDGSKLTFMAIPSGYGLTWSNMRVYVLDLAEPQGEPKDLGIGQDPKFSADGSKIIFKKNGWDKDYITYGYQLWTMRSDSENGDDAEQLTFSTGEKSGPNYSPDGNLIVYWLNAKENADIWIMNEDGTGEEENVATPGVQDYYPIFRDDDNILFAESNPSDKIYNFVISTQTPKRLDGLNSTPGACGGSDCEDSDAFPVNNLIGFSSTRKNDWPDYDLYISGEDGTPFGEISEANSTIGELGGVYSPYTFARKLLILNPSNEIGLEASSSYLFEVSAYSDGDTWSDANPSVTLSGPESHIYTGLKDDGTSGDQVAGDGIYSKTVTLPSETGTYSVIANAISLDNGFENIIVSAPVSVSLFETTRIIRLSGDLAFGNVTVGQSAQRTLTIHNDGNSMLSVTGINCPTGFNGNWSGSISASGYQDVTVTFTPTTAQSYSGNITINSNNNGGTKTRICSGTGTYAQQTGSLQVTISPSEAVSDGAQWRVDSGTWRNSGYTENSLSVGSHSVEFNEISDWSKPGNQTVTIVEGQITNASGMYTLLETQVVATPSISPIGGNYTSLPTITLSCPTPNAAIHYTTDGSTPTSNSTEYTGPFTVISNEFTLMVRGFRDGYTESEIASADFTITSTETPELSVTPITRTVNDSAGTAIFIVNNVGTGTMLWTSSVISGGDWLSTTSGSSGTNSGTISVAFSENSAGSSRTGIIRITASGAIGSPIDVTVTQASGETDTDGDGINDTADTDDDNDGIDDSIENAGTNHGDGNNDGIADSLQNNVTSIQSYGGGEYITLASPAGTSLSNCQAVSNPATDSAPGDIEFPYGLIDFTINGLAPGGSTTLMLYFPASATLGTYYKYGRTPGDPNDHWYEFLYDGATGAEIDNTNKIITLHFIDAERGDDILSVDSMVVDLGGPGVASNTVSSGSNPNAGGGGGGGGGGCFITASQN